MAKKKKKKVISKQEKSLKSKIYYNRYKNKKIIEKLDLFKDETFYKLKTLKVSENFKGIKFKQKDKVKGSTLKNILRNKIKDNNSLLDKTYSTLKNKFKKDLKHKQTKKRAKGIDFIASPLFSAWEYKDIDIWIKDYVKDDKKQVEYYIKVSELMYIMGSPDLLQMTYDRKLKIFDCAIID